MEFRIKVHIPPAPFTIEPTSRLLLVGSCFAQNMGQRFADNQFPTLCNPFGVMYNPVSILHTLRRLRQGEGTPFTPDVAVITLGTNHVYVLKETGEVVDNCQKRPARLFDERQLTVEECVQALTESRQLLREMNPQVRIILTVSPIRYQKYGFHGSQLSKATLLLAIDRIVQSQPAAWYFPAYEILNDELRDYRFYAPDMLHPSPQAVDYIWQRLQEATFSQQARQFVAEWQPLAQALAHRPFHPDAPEYQQFLSQTRSRITAFRQKYHLPDTPA